MRQVTKVLASLLTLIPIHGLTAQGIVTPLRLEGEKVRVRVAADSSEEWRQSFRVQGTVVGQRGDTIQVVEARGRLWNLHVSSVQSIEISRGRDHWRGAGFGALVGVVSGLLLSLTPPDCNERGYGIDCRRDGSFPTTAQYVGSNVGDMVFAGTIIGFGFGKERWERITARQRMSVAPVARGIGLRVSF